jgi:hypothetical protein
MIISKFRSESKSDVGLNSMYEGKLVLVVDKLICKLDKLDLILLLHEELIKISNLTRFKLKLTYSKSL